MRHFFELFLLLEKFLITPKGSPLHTLKQTGVSKPKKSTFFTSLKTSFFLCNVHQSAPKFRSRTKKSANQNGRPGRSLKSKKEKARGQKKDPPQTKRRKRRHAIERHLERPGIVPSQSKIADFVQSDGSEPEHSAKNRRTVKPVEEHWKC